MSYTHLLETVGASEQLATTCPPLTEAEDALTRDVMGSLAGKWPLHVLRVLAAVGGPLRFSRMLEAAAGITHKVLTQTLRHLERDGFITRKVFPQVPPKVEYALTDLGRELLIVADPVIAWSGRNVGAFEAARRQFDAKDD